MIQTQTHLGKSLACLGGSLAVLSFLGLPWLSFGFFGNYTAVQLALLPTQGMQGFLWSSFLWLEFSWATGITVLALIAHFKKEIEQSISLALILLAAVALLGAMGMYGLFSQGSFFSIPYTTFLGTGFWYYSLSLTLALIGAIVQRILASSQKRGRPGNPHLFP